MRLEIIKIFSAPSVSQRLNSTSYGFIMICNLEFYLPHVSVPFIILDSGVERKRNTGEKNGGGAGTRTPDTGIMIPLLYQLSYTAPKKLRG